ncbi:MAG: hypothetical protein WEB60_07590, partial [Terrimicrobiaceae bacterium]
LSKTDTMAEITRATHRYAKRQLTWFRNQTSCQELPWKPSLSDLVEEALTALPHHRIPLPL